MTVKSYVFSTISELDSEHSAPAGKYRILLTGEGNIKDLQ